eukprot:gene10422-9555_t
MPGFGFTDADGPIPDGADMAEEPVDPEDGLLEFDSQDDERASSLTASQRADRDKHILENHESADADAVRRIAELRAEADVVEQHDQ